MAYKKTNSYKSQTTKKYPKNKELVLYGVQTTIQVPEMKIRYNKGKLLPKISDSKTTYECLLKIIGRDISIHEQFIVLFLDNALNVLGYYKHSIGTPVGTLVDIPTILGVALKSMARKIILAHNHPSGVTSPSNGDKLITQKIGAAAKAVDLAVVDHLIFTKNNGYYSFSDNHEKLEGLSKNYSKHKTMKKKNISTQGKQIMKIAKEIRKKNPRKKWQTCVKEAGKAFKSKR